MSMEISKRMSGRYPWGEGVEAFPNALAFAERVKALKKQGIPIEDVRKEVNLLLPEDRRMKPTEFRVAFSFAWGGHHVEIGNEIIKLHDEGYTWSDIARKMKLHEPTVKQVYANRMREEERRNKRQKLFDALRTQTEKHGVIIVPYGECEDHGFYECWLDESIYALEAEHGFTYFRVKCHLGYVSVLAKPGVSRSYTLAHKSRIGLFDWSEGLDVVAEP